MVRIPDKDREMAREMREMIKARGAVTLIPCSPEIRAFFENEVCPVVRDQALSSLRKHNEFAPVLLGFMESGKLSAVDVSSAVGGTFGSEATKEMTAAVHQLAAQVPGCKASVFAVETWTLASSDRGALKGSIAEHPDRGEAIAINCLHYVDETHSMMQLFVVYQVIKVLGDKVSREMWQHTKLGGAVFTDAGDARNKQLKGRFIVGSSADDT